MGTNQSLSALRSKFWKIKGQKTVRNVIERCSRCKKLKAKECKPLPIERLAVSERPFSSVGADYLRPFCIKRGRVLEKNMIPFLRV